MSPEGLSILRDNGDNQVSMRCFAARMWLYLLVTAESSASSQHSAYRFRRSIDHWIKDARSIKYFHVKSSSGSAFQRRLMKRRAQCAESRSMNLQLGKCPVSFISVADTTSFSAESMLMASTFLHDSSNKLWSKRAFTLGSGQWARLVARALKHCKVASVSPSASGAWPLLWPK